MVEYPLTVRYVLDKEWMETLCEMAGYGIGYWADELRSGDDGVTVRWQEHPSRHSKALTYGSLARALQRILAGEVKVNDALLASAYGSVHDPGDIDADLADVVIQVATFGRIIYG